MNPSPLLPGIILHQLVGSSATSNGIQFIPAFFEFEHEEENDSMMVARPEYRLEKSRLGSLDLRTLMGSYGDFESTLLTAWVRARIPAIFGYQPPRAQFIRKPEVLGISFLAVPPWDKPEDIRIVPFTCTSWDYREPGLVFRSTEENGDAKRRIAEAFWDLLTCRPLDLHPFEEFIYDEFDDEGPLREGFGRGRLFMQGMHDIEVEELRWDEHATWQDDLPYCCPDCDGTGVEDWFPFTEDCLTCGGTGGISWGVPAS